MNRKTDMTVKRQIVGTPESEAYEGGVESACYARLSDLKNGRESSIEDQVRECREEARRDGGSFQTQMSFPIAISGESPRVVLHSIGFSRLCAPGRQHSRTSMFRTPRAWREVRRLLQNCANSSNLTVFAFISWRTA